MFAQLESALISLASTLPLEIFVLVASCVEEILAPIPSPTVMVVSGSLALIQERPLLALIPLAVIGAVGKTVGGLVVYAIADKAEDIVTGKFGRFFGVTGEDIQNLGRRIGSGLRGYLTLTVLRALPFVPSVILSVGSGILKVPVSMFIVSTFVGTIFRDGFYLYAGYAGTQVLTALVARTDNLETYVEAAAILAVVLLLGYRFYQWKVSRKMEEQ